MAVNGTDKKNSYHQERAIAALLSTRTIPEAAAVAGVGERTVNRWLSEDEGFVTEYRTARRQVVEHAVSKLQNATTEAVETLRYNLNCGSPSTEERAALGILGHAVKAVELYDLEERLSELERRSAE
jgi:transposase